MSKARRAMLIGLDGADPLLVRRFMTEGRLPNLARLKQCGSTTKSLGMLGAHPTMTPPNWASLATGAWPGTHGITCFWNHTLGNPLDQLDYAFNSRLSKAEFIWDAAAKAGKRSIVFNYPTGWPPSSDENLIVVDGSSISVDRRSVADNECLCTFREGLSQTVIHTHAGDDSGMFCTFVGEDTKVFEPRSTPEGIKVQVAADGMVAAWEGDTAGRILGPIRPAKGWAVGDTGSALPAKEIELPVNNGTEVRYGRLIAAEGSKYDTLELYSSRDARTRLGTVRVGQWSDWIYDTFSGVVRVAYKVKLLQLADDGTELKLYVSFPNNLDDVRLFYPRELNLKRMVGPILHQSHCDDEHIRLEAQAQLYEWYSRSLKYLMGEFPDWSLLYMHCHALDYANHSYQNLILERHNPTGYQQALDTLAKYYEISDRLVGDLVTAVGPDTVVVVVSDHGGMSREYSYPAPLGDPHAIGGKLMEELGYLVVKRDNGRAQVDWSKTRAICQRSGFIYVNLKGRDPQGIVEPDEYESLVEEIIDALLTYRDPESGRRPIALALCRRDMPLLGLYGDNVGDIFFAVNPSWARVHGTTVTTASFEGTSVGCLFLMSGPGVKKGAELARPVRITDVVPTLCHLSGLPIPKDAEGGVIYQALDA